MTVTDIKESVVKRKSDDLPEAIAGDADATAVYGLLQPFIVVHIADAEQARQIVAETAKSVWGVFPSNRKAGYSDDLDAQRRTMNEMDDHLYDEVKRRQGIDLTTVEMDEIIEKTMQLARHRMAG